MCLLKKDNWKTVDELDQGAAKHNKKFIIEIVQRGASHIGQEEYCRRDRILGKDPHPKQGVGRTVSIHFCFYPVVSAS